jgi:hypothetical protein
MTRLILKAIDLGASVVFMALCTKAFCAHFRTFERRDPPLRINLPHNQALTPSVEALK